MDVLIDKQKVADSFSRAAITYDSVAELQRSVGQTLMEFLPETLEHNVQGFHANQPKRIMDLGCGTGFFSPKLHQAYPHTHLINLDLAFGMLRYARENRKVEKASWLCADAESLPLADRCVDIVFSSLAIQWCENLPALMLEIERVLAPGGRFVFATLGPDTLHELRTAWRSVDSFTHVNQFLSSQEHLSAIPSSLNVIEFKEEERILRYQQLKGLTDELKNLGAHNMNAGQKTGLTGREQIRRFKAAYEEQRLSDGAIPATYQVFYGVLEKPVKGLNS